ncbi:hypothetical protein L9F63_008662, partial [Diploptera punctata]
FSRTWTAIIRLCEIHSKDTNMFTIEERIEIVAARLRGQSYEEVRDRLQRKPSRETCFPKGGLEGHLL